MMNTNGCALFLLASVSAASAGDDIPRPNVLFILADDVGQEVLGCYGGESYSTPHLDELARNGMRFRHAYSMPVCHPTRLTLMTGQYPIRQGKVTWGDFPKEDEAHTFASKLNAAGYSTAIAGKWQLTLLRDDPEHPLRLGFDQWDLFGWHEGPRYYEPMIYRNGRTRENTLGFYGPDLYVRSLIEFMKENRDGPFFAYYSMALCHDVTDDLEEPVPHGPFDRYDSFAEMVTEMDRNVGRLVAALNALDLRENTLILFVADNGTPKRMIARAEGKQLIKVPVISRRNGRDVPGGKGELTNGGTSVPMIANWPGTIKAGQIVDDLVDFSDFLPTFIDLAGAQLTSDRTIDGTSFADRLRGQGASPRTWAYSESAVLPKPGGVEPDGEHSGLRWVRNVRWKLYSDGRLYDMQLDDGERAAIPKAADTPAQSTARGTLIRALESL
jgi:arylsulfatase A-like enzyme